jgi:hypothetical protein
MKRELRRFRYYTNSHENCGNRELLAFAAQR